MEIFEQILTSKLEEIILLQVINQNKSPLFLFSDGNNEDNDTDELRFTKNTIKKILSVNNIKPAFSYLDQTVFTDTNYYKVIIRTETFKTKYTRFIKNKFLGEKTIERKLSGTIYITAGKQTDTSGNNTTIAINYRDEIPYDEYKNYENSDFNFTQGKAPEINFFERIIFPAILITASAGAILAFFIIRTK